MDTFSARQPLSTSFRAKQPGKTIWTILCILFGSFRLTFLLLYFIPSRLRQHRQWSYRQALGTAVLKSWFSFASTVEYRTSHSLEPGAEKERFVVMNPAKPELYSEILSDKMIKPAPVGGMWYPTLHDPKLDKDKWVVLHFHGGAFVLGGVRPKEGGWGPDVLAKAINGLVLGPQYRLSSEPNCRFPAALLDCVTAYQHLLDHGIPSSQIVISGDSAGGNLVLGVLCFLGEPSNSLPLPFAALLWGPWLDLAADPNAINQHRNRNLDYITPVLVKWGVRAYLPSWIEPNHPYITPLNNPFSTKVPIFMQHGTAEILYDEQELFYQQMKEVPGNYIERMEIANAPHNTFLAGQILGFEKEAAVAADRAKRFLDDREDSA